MRIKTLASLTGASQKALRHYEALGLLGEVPRLGRYRDYGAVHVELVSLIRRAQQFGFALAELQTARDGRRGIAWGRVQQLVLQRQAQLQAEQSRLARQLDELAAIALELSQCPQASAPVPAGCLVPAGA
jgi:MerR family transcriptional regulator, copper efflux regulator